MSALGKIIAAHPLSDFMPYNAIKFARVDGMGTPLYTVAKEAKEMGAEAAIARAVELLGGHCFHCGKFMKAQRLSQECNRDHIRARQNGGGNFLHNIVISCGPCNRGKAASHLIDYRRDSAIRYFEALDEHLSFCVESLNKK